MKSRLPKLAHLSPRPIVFIPLHSALVTTLNQCLSLLSSHCALLNSSLNETSDLHIRGKYGLINLDANSSQMTAIDTIASLATYNYEESIPGAAS